MAVCTARLGDRRDYHSLARLRGEWLDDYHRAKPAQVRWCPAACPIPAVETERDLFQSVAQRDGHFAALLEDTESPTAYVLCKADEQTKTLAILAQTPRVRPGRDQAEAIPPLLLFALRWAQEHALGFRPTYLHGFPEDIGFLVSSYRKMGFTGVLRYEMVRHGRTVQPAEERLAYRSAREVGEEQYFQIEADLSDRPVAEVRQDCEFSRKMWLVDPDRDWVIGYHQDQPVGIVRTALEHEGNAVVDELLVGKRHRGSGYGTDLLRRALGALAGLTDLWRLDVDETNAKARHLYEKVGFRVLHHHVLLIAPAASAHVGRQDG